ncbi:hypothetical protein SpCBS45565_g07476 [Spizellomyces sp. 'palustris']|nr:hypothetical protein SpCBS45565_g07476 [Spizellomyces sp. 'palustris']
MLHRSANTSWGITKEDPSPDFIGVHEENQDIAALAREYEKALRTNPAYWAFKKLVREQNETLKSPNATDVVPLARQIFNQTGGARQLIENHVALVSARKKRRAQVAREVQKCEGSDPNALSCAEGRYRSVGPKDHLAVESARRTLESLITKRLNRISADMAVPLSRKRTPHEETIFLDRSSSSNQEDTSSNPPLVLQGIGLPSKGVRDPDRLYLYDDQDVLETVMNVQMNISHEESPEFGTFWSSIPALFTRGPSTIQEMARKFSLLSPRYQHVGVNDWVDDNPETFLAARIEAGEKVLASKSLQQARDYAKNGMPPCLRAQLWDLILQSELTDDLAAYTRHHCQTLKADIARYDLLIDRLIRIDARQCRNDDCYFVFEDIISDVMSYWVRDEWIAQHAAAEQKQSHVMACPGKIYPPNGVLPFWGISCYALPLCFLHGEAEDAYMIFRELYTRFFFNLHTVRLSSTPTLPTLCKTFEYLLKEHDPYIFFHLTHHLGILPVTYACRWIMFAFVGILDIEQVLLLWDRMLGYEEEGMELLSVAAAAIFAFRSDMLCRARNLRDVEHAFSDLGAVKIIPLLQSYLFSR